MVFLRVFLQFTILRTKTSTSHLVSRDAARVAGPDFRLVEVDAFAHLLGI